MSFRVLDDRTLPLVEGIATLRFKNGAAFVRFSLDGKRLLVLTSGQVAYAFDTDRMSTAKGDSGSGSGV